MNEEQLISKAKRGDVDALGQLLEEHYEMIFRIAYKWCGSEDDAKDIAQDVCIKVAKAIKKYKRKAKLSTWLYSITINTCKDNLKRKKPITALDEKEHQSESISPLEKMELSELWMIVNKLPDNQKDAVLLVYGEGLNHAEASEVLACKESTISWYIHEAKKYLTAIYKEGQGNG